MGRCTSHNVNATSGVIPEKLGNRTHKSRRMTSMLKSKALELVFKSFQETKKKERKKNLTP
jgi:hypothetical protein